MGGTYALRRLAVGAVLVSTFSLVEPAFADEQNAEQMFQLGLAAMKKKDYATACEAFAKSNRADPSSGTQINLALCYEKKKQWASAWTWYRSAVGLAQQKGQHEREKLAEDSAARVLPQVHYVIVTTKEPLTEESVQRDGVEVTTTLNGKEVPVPVDPGARTFTVVAKNKRSWSATITAADNNKTDRIEVPVLEALPVEVPVGRPSPVDPTVAGYRPPQRDGTGQRVAGVIVGSAGVLGGLAAFGTFILANQQADKRRENRDAETKASSTVAHPDYKTAADKYASATDNDRLIGYIITGGAVVLLGVGATLFFTAPKTPTRVREARIRPLLTPTFAGLGAGGSF